MSDKPPEYALHEAQKPPTNTSEGGPEEGHRGSPLVAVLLSLIPGAGHFYLGQRWRGFAYFLLVAVMASLIYWSTRTHEFEVFPALVPVLVVLTVLFWIWVAGSAARAAVGERFFSTLGLLVVLLYTYLLGWQVIEVDLQKFFTEFPDTFNIFTRVIWPWREGAAWVRLEESAIVGTPWLSPCPDDAGEIPAPVDGTGEEPWVAVEPACGEFAHNEIQGTRIQQVPGAEITVYGGGFNPNEEITIWWVDPIKQAFRPQLQTGNVVTTSDGDGNFSITFTAPPYTTPSSAVGIQQHTIQARQVVSVGNVQLSENVTLAGNRMIVTIFQALMATTLGIVFAIPLSFVAARNLMGTNVFTVTVYYVVRFLLNVIRSIEPIIWAVIAITWVGLGPFAGVLALMLHTVASLAKLYSEAIESIDPGPIEAVTSTGANRLQTIVYAIVPQVIPPFLSFTLYRWDINVRMSTIIGIVGGGGIGQILIQWINQTRWSSAGIAVWMIAITVSLLDYASSELRKRFV